jgi:hypothetical protein
MDKGYVRTLIGSPYSWKRDTSSSMAEHCLIGGKNGSRALRHNAILSLHHPATVDGGPKSIL